jgi:hypothetical protein
VARLHLVGGSYSARSIIANAQRCINYFPEINPKDSPVPITYYQRPGFRALVTGIAAPVRCLYRASNGNGYCCIGANIYSISPLFALTLLGTISPGRINPVSMIDNGIMLVIVDGSANGWQINLANNVFSAINDPTHIFAGGIRADVMDTFLLFSQPNSNIFVSSLSATVTFDPTYFASKATYPDPTQTLIVRRHEFFLIGALKSEIWYNAGGVLFPFQQLPGAYIEQGTVAPYSVAGQDVSIYWLGQSLEGTGMVMRQKGYDTQRISNHALEFAIRQMITNNISVADAIGYCYQQDGHVFYVLSFPSGDQTWVYDEAIADPMLAWHQRVWTDINGVAHRDRSNCHANMYGVNVVGDWQNGTLYKLDLNYYNDQVSGIEGEIEYLRSFPHMIQTGYGLQPGLLDGKRVKFNRFSADIESGNAVVGSGAPINLRWSDDRGKTFGNIVIQRNGETGEYLTQPTWPGLGIARDRIFELSHSLSCPAALNGAWVEADVLES